MIGTLLERRLVKIMGRKRVVGRPFLYGTTREFLIRFGLKDLTDLPRIEDMAEALGFDVPAGLMDTAPATLPDQIDPVDEGEESPAPELEGGGADEGDKPERVH